MTGYGPWQDGATHTLRVDYSSDPSLFNATYAWDNPSDPHPVANQVLAIAAGGTQRARAEFVQYPTQAHPADDPDAHACMWTHAARDTSFSQIFWRPDQPPACPAPMTDATTNASTGLYATAGYEYTVGNLGAPGNAAWSNYHSTVSLAGPTYDPAGAFLYTNAHIPPAGLLPPGVVGIDYDPDDTLTLLSGSFDGYTGGDLSPKAYLRAWQTGDPIIGWWPSITGGTEQQGLIQDAATVSAWVGAGKGVGPFAPGQTASLPSGLLNYLAPAPIATAPAQRTVDMVFVTSNMLDRNVPTPPDVHASWLVADPITMPKFTLVYRSARWRYIYDIAVQPPLRQFPRTDGLATSSARRVWPPARSAQGSNRQAGRYL